MPVALHQGGLQHLPHAINVAAEPCRLSRAADLQETAPELQVREARFSFGWSGIAELPLLELIRRACSERALLPSMGLDAGGPRQPDLEQPGLQLG